MDYWHKKFANNVKRYRELRNFSKSYLASLVDCDISYIGKLERAEKSPNFKIIVKLALALEVTPKDLFE